MSALSRILVATDFSRGSGVAVARAGLLAREHQADLRLIHASPDWNLFCRFLPAQQAHYTTLTQHAEAAMQREIEWLQQRYGIRAHGGVELGSATRTIARVVQDFQPQLVVIGARGEHGPSVSSSALGGTAMKLLLQTTRPLLLVRDTCSRTVNRRAKLTSFRRPTLTRVERLLRGLRYPISSDGRKNCSLPR
jgi:nucleotide-binding universal stress UspA family protein